MEKMSFVRQGVLRLPPGFRFRPTDEELLLQYLKRKVFSCPLPAAIIPEIDLGKHDPWDLPGGCEEERYFFNHKEAKYQTGNRSNRAAISGYWKATGKDKQIVAPRSNQVIGMKKVLIFYRGKAPSRSRTDYIMHEYRLASCETQAAISMQRKNSIHSLIAPSGDWVVCRIFKKKRAARTEEVRNRDRNTGIRPVDFLRQEDRYQNPNSSSLMESSCVTDVSKEAVNDEETSSANMSSPT